MKMTSTIEKLFVNRDRELDVFRQMLKKQSAKHIMTLCAPGGMGKSWLMARLQHECSCEEIPTCEIDFSSSKVYDYLAVLRHTRDAYGAKHFNAFTDVVNNYTQSHPLVQIGGGTASASTKIDVENITGSQVAIAGRDINIIVVKDNYFRLPETPTVPLQQIREYVTAEFVSCLRSFVANRQEPVVWFFDKFEDASQEVVPWLYDEFLVKTLDPEFHNLIFVIAGRTVPEFGLEWDHVVCAYRLDKLTVDDFEEYVRKTNIPMSEETVKWLHRAFEGNIQQFALKLQAYEQEENL